MEPRIQYAKTEDGVSIAFSTLGEGLPVVQMPAPFSHLQLDWEIREFRRWHERLAEKRMVVRYDTRGSGLSDRDVTDFSLDAGVRDLEAVVDRLGLERFALLAPLFSGPASIAYAVRHPERVSHLILWNSGARTTDVTGGPQGQALQQLANADWEMFTETLAHVAFGWSAGEPARRYAAVIRESVTQEWLQASLAAPDVDVTELLPQVTSPTLVLHRRETPFPSVDTARGLASRIPNARLALLPGGAGAPHIDDSEALHSAIDEFLGEGEEAEPVTLVAPGGLVTILFTDMEGSTTLTERLGDAAAQEVRHAHNDIVRSALSDNGGSEIKHTGDGIMASFSTASSALDCAIAIQRGVAAHKEAHPESPLGVYVGLNAGEPIAEDDDLFGTSINLAARICDHAEAGQILAANVVRELAAGKDFLFADLGETELRGFEDPVKLWELRWEEDA